AYSAPAPARKAAMCLIRSVTSEKADASQRVLPSTTPEGRPGDQASARGVHGDGAAAIRGGDPRAEEPDLGRILPHPALPSQSGNSGLGAKAAGAATRWAARAVRPEPGAHARAPVADQRSALRQAAGGRPAHADSGARTAWAVDSPGAPPAAPPPPSPHPP